MKTLISFFLACLIMFGCDSETPKSVTATAQPPAVEIFNNTEKPVFYFLIETNTSHVIDLADPCNQFQPNLPAKSTLKIPYDQILGFDKDAKSAWFMWTDCQGNSDSRTVQLFN